jgi:amidase
MDEQSPESICFMPATELADGIRDGSLSAVEVMQAFLARIDRLNPDINAIPILLPGEKAIELARHADAQIAQYKPVGPLHGVPIAIKDLANVKGMLTTRGSPLFQDNVAVEDSLFVERLRAAGAIIIGKTNVPEFGAGSHTFNPLFGATRNPYDLSKSAGGSSGGAAAAVATGMLPLADGSDMGGSLRNPAAFNNVFAIRPTIGRVPSLEGGWMTRHATEGPIARNVKDACLLLSVMAGHDPRDPLSIRESGDVFLQSLEKDFTSLRIGWGGDLGCMTVDPEILEVCQESLGVFAQLGCAVDEAHPDLGDAMEVFQVQRALGNIKQLDKLAAVNPDWRSFVKETVLWNIDLGLQLTPQQIARSDATRLLIFERMQKYFAEYDFLVLPSTQVAPFDIELDWVREINGEPMETYIDWMRACCIITVTGCPAASIPCGFTRSGLPVGLQIVGKPWQEMDLLKLCDGFEKAIELNSPQPFGS